MIKTFGDKKITIRKLAPSDLKRAKEFQLNINSLIKEETMLLLKIPKSLKEEQEFLKDILKKIKSKRGICIVAECDNRIIGLSDMETLRERSDHMADFGISIINGFRGIGLGKAMMEEIIKLAKKDLNPKPKIIKLTVFENNLPAIKLYKKMGFKKVARIPDELQYKGKLVAHLVMLKYL